MSPKPWTVRDRSGLLFAGFIRFIEFPGAIVAGSGLNRGLGGIVIGVTGFVGFTGFLGFIVMESGA